MVDRWGLRGFVTGSLLLLEGFVNTGGGGNPLTVSINGPAFYVAGNTSSHTFSTNTVSISGGTGPYTEAWSCTSDAFGSWTASGTGTTFTPSVSHVTIENSSTGTLTCTVTDTGTGNVQTSNSVPYTYYHLGSF